MKFDTKNITDELNNMECSLNAYFLKRSEPRDANLQNKIKKLQSLKMLNFFENIIDPLQSNIFEEISLLYNEYHEYLDSEQNEFSEGLKTNMLSRIFELIIASLIHCSGYKLKKRPRKQGSPDLEVDGFFIECTSFSSSFFWDWDKKLHKFHEYIFIVKDLLEKRGCNAEEPPEISISQVWNKLNLSEINEISNRLQCQTKDVLQDIIDWILLNKHISCYSGELIPYELKANLEEVNINMYGTREIDYSFISKRLIKCITDKVQKPYFQDRPGLLAISVAFVIPGLPLSEDETKTLLEHLNANYEQYMFELLREKSVDEKEKILKGLNNLIALIIDTSWYNWFPSSLKEHDKLHYSDPNQNNFFYLLYNEGLSSCNEFNFNGFEKRIQNHKKLNLIPTTLLDEPLKYTQENAVEILCQEVSSD